MSYRLGPRARHVYDVLRDRIIAGELLTGAQLPSRHALAGQFGVARMTIEQALKTLERDGLIVSDHGRGTFVRGLAEAVETSAAVLALGEDRYRTLVDASADGIILVDLKGRVLAANKRAAELHGYARPEDMYLLQGPALVAPECRERSGENLSRILTEGHVPPFEYLLLRKDGTKLRAEVSAAVIRDAAGTATAFTAVVRDVSERGREATLRAQYEAIAESSSERNHRREGRRHCHKLEPPCRTGLWLHSR